MTILDAHVHVWDPEHLPYDWLADAGILNRPFLPGDLDDADGRVGEWVFVEADVSPDHREQEADWVADAAWPGLVGIVAAVRLDDPDLAARLDALAARPRVVGVRDLLQDDSLARFEDEGVRAGLRAVGENGLRFDACVRWPQLGALDSLIATAPGTPVVIDHLGKPPVDDGLASAAGRRWRDDLARIAERPHVHVKCSGLAAEASSPAILAARGPAFVAEAVALFGAERVLLGSDQPVSGVAATGVSSTAWIDLVEDAVPAEAWAWIGREAARRFYSLV